MVKNENIDISVVSMLMDSEIDDSHELFVNGVDEVLDSVLADENLTNAWHEFHLISDCLGQLRSEFTGEISSVLSTD